MTVVTDLHKHYPKNYLLELSKAALQVRLKAFDQAIATYTGILAKIETRKDGYERLEAPKVLLLLAKAYLDSSDVTKGLEVYDRVISYPGASGTERANAHLWLGKLHDVMSQRDQALPHYDAILSLDCTARLKEEARNYRRKPFAW
jgi:tetratricopeptide (TPR) repeat protein